VHEVTITQKGVTITLDRVNALCVPHCVAQTCFSSGAQDAWYARFSAHPGCDVDGILRSACKVVLFAVPSGQALSESSVAICDRSRSSSPTRLGAGSEAARTTISEIMVNQTQWLKAKARHLDEIEKWCRGGEFPRRLVRRF